MLRSGLPAAFLPSVIATAVVVGLCVWFGLNIWFLAILMLTALVSYYFYVNRLGEQNINNADSVYYFGFSITVVTLAASAIASFGSSVEVADLKTVFSQFGIGLIATCIGLILRLLIVAKIDGSAKAQLDEVEARRLLVQDLLSLRDAASRFRAELSDLSSVFADLRKAMQDDFFKPLREQSAEAVQALRKQSEEGVRELRLQSEETVRELGRATQVAINTIGNTGQNIVHTIEAGTIDAFGALKDTGLTVAEQVRNSVMEIEKSLQSMRLEDVATRASDAMHRITAGTEALSGAVVASTDKLSATSDVLADFNINILDCGKDLLELKAQVGETSQGLVDNVADLNISAMTSKGILKSLGAQTQAFAKEFELLQAQGVKAVKDVQESVKRVSEALVQVAQDAARVASEHKLSEAHNVDTQPDMGNEKGDQHEPT